MCYLALQTLCFNIIGTSVACAVGLNVNTLTAQPIFPSKPKFCICFLNFQQQNPLKNQYLPHNSSENCEIKFIKSDLPRAFQNYQEHPQIPIHFGRSQLDKKNYLGSEIDGLHDLP
jgi:hypothetical protein